MSHSLDTPGAGDRHDREQRRRKRHLDEKLDQALEETFPASDPIELTPEPERPPADDEAR